MFQNEYAIIEVADALAISTGTRPTDPVVRAIAAATARYSVRAVREELGDSRTPSIADLRAKSIESLTQLRNHIDAAIADLRSRPTTL